MRRVATRRALDFGWTIEIDLKQLKILNEISGKSAILCQNFDEEHNK